MERIASIDIGTNTVLMVVADISDSKYEVVREEFSIPRLGENVDKEGKIIEAAFKRTSEVITNYRNICNELKVEKILAVGTSALRDAENAKEIRLELENILDAKIRIIHGEEEAQLSFKGSVTTTELSTLIDIGGGSTEIIIGESGNILERKSLQMGAVRITERILKNIYPIIPEYYIEAEIFIRSELDKLFKINNKAPLFACAGTPTAIATAISGLHDYEAKQINGTKIGKKQVYDLLQEFRKLTQTKISEKYLINLKRADLITAGAMILYTFMDYFGFEECIVSAMGLRYGIIVDYMETISKE
jgi:exopolyphosphatase/guanosine-5'-triphosphate,3'-diphosphate pyrophosphatase